MGLDRAAQKRLLEIARQMFNGEYIDEKEVKEQTNGPDWRAGTNLDNSRASGSTGLPTSRSTDNTSRTTDRIPQGASSGLRIDNLEHLRNIILDKFGYMPQELKQRAEPFKAWKQARVDERRGTFLPLVTSASYQPIDTAVCTRDWQDQGHQAPDEKCSCGFYGYKGHMLARHYSNSRPNPLWDMIFNENELVLEVEFYGKVIEHRDGYRAEKQRVIAIWMTRELGDRGWVTTPPAHWQMGKDFDQFETINYTSYSNYIRNLLKIEVNVVDSLDRIPFTRTNPFDGSVE